jgi:hypothetical protein
VNQNRAASLNIESTNMEFTYDVPLLEQIIDQVQSSEKK